MPLIEEIEETEPLRQGDILRGVMLYATSPDGGAQPLGTDRCLVLSRNCNALRDEQIAVAAVLPYKAEAFKALAADDLSFGETRRRLAAIRDGDGSPDVFYLGTFPGEEHVRYQARFDSLHSVVVPADGNGTRQAWIKSRRVASLTSDLRRHLHARLLSAVAPEGFDDCASLCDSDLRLLVHRGQQRLNEAKSALDATKVDIDAAPIKFDPKMLRKVLASLDSKKLNEERAVDELASELRPWADELARREGAS